MSSPTFRSCRTRRVLLVLLVPLGSSALHFTTISGPDDVLMVTPQRPSKASILPTTPAVGGAGGTGKQTPSITAVCPDCLVPMSPWTRDPRMAADEAESWPKTAQQVEKEQRGKRRREDQKRMFESGTGMSPWIKKSPAIRSPPTKKSATASGIRPSGSAPVVSRISRRLWEEFDAEEEDGGDERPTPPVLEQSLRGRGRIVFF